MQFAGSHLGVPAGCVGIDLFSGEMEIGFHCLFIQKDSEYTIVDLATDDCADIKMCFK